MEVEERAADPLAGGITKGYQCGMIWAAALAAGVRAYRLYGAGPQAEAHAIIAAQAMLQAFRAQNKNTNCRDITRINMAAATTPMIVRFLVKSAPTGSCFGMAARYAPRAFSEIESAISSDQGEAPPDPVSCAGLVARKMGASAMHQVMAAGLAGGIGLSGGACGALGAAIWIGGINVLNKGDKIGFQAPHAHDVLERFQTSTGCEFECSRIVGRRFESIADHAGYVRAGGCGKLIEVLANPM